MGQCKRVSIKSCTVALCLVSWHCASPSLTSIDAGMETETKTKKHHCARGAKRRNKTRERKRKVRNDASSSPSSIISF